MRANLPKIIIARPRPERKAALSWSEQFRNISLGIAGIVSSILIPLFALYYTSRDKGNEVGKDLIEIATKILSANPAPENIPLRIWAIATINNYSNVQLRGSAAEILITGQTIFGDLTNPIFLKTTIEIEKEISSFIGNLKNPTGDLKISYEDSISKYNKVYFDLNELLLMAKSRLNNDPTIRQVELLIEMIDDLKNLHSKQQPSLKFLEQEQKDLRTALGIIIRTENSKLYGNNKIADEVRNAGSQLAPRPVPPPPKVPVDC